MRIYQKLMILIEIQIKN